MVDFQLSSVLMSQSMECRAVPFSPRVCFRPLWFISAHMVRNLSKRCRSRKLFASYPSAARSREFVRPFRDPNIVGNVVIKVRGGQVGALLHQERAECGGFSRLIGSTGDYRDQIPPICRAHSFDSTVDDSTLKSLGSENTEYVGKESGSRKATTHERDSTKKESAPSADDVKVLAQYMTRHNFVRVLEVSRSANTPLAGARVLLLDKPGNIHSIYQKYTLLTNSYYDIFAAIPAVIPEGPIGILGLGAGTAARLIHHFWPEVDIHGWELDPGVVQAARKYFDMEELEWKESGLIESYTEPVERRRKSCGKYGAWLDESDEIRMNPFLSQQVRGGRLRVHIGDALSSEATVPGGFSGLVVDLFAEGAVIPALQEADTWRKMRLKLRAGGRIIVNCGGSCVESAELEKKDGGITMKETIVAIAEAFPGELSILSLNLPNDNALALTGPSPDLDEWKATLPECLKGTIDDWKPFLFI